MKKQLDEDGVEYVHGRAVEIYEGKVTTAFPMEYEDAIGLSDGDTVTLIMTVRAGIPKFTNIRKSGQLKCTNQFNIEYIEVIDPDKAKFIYDQMDAYVPDISNPVTISHIDDLGFDPKSLEV